MELADHSTKSISSGASLDESPERSCTKGRSSCDSYPILVITQLGATKLSIMWAKRSTVISDDDDITVISDGDDIMG